MVISATARSRILTASYIGSVIDLDALTKISRQLDVSMGSMMGMVNGFAVVIFMILIYLLSKIIIEKNAQSISMTKDTGLYQWRNQQTVYSVYFTGGSDLSAGQVCRWKRLIMKVLFTER